jgi:hypothetical protein
MLDFLGLAPQGAGNSKMRPRSFRTYLELVNVSATEKEVKCLFVNAAYRCSVYCLLLGQHILTYL